ncbi:hypothetical protein ACIGEZ_22940 [Streptomyces sp. NPDC085481]|uniref:hypothetical protein n=1 Tax=Streptomyces sp. NPDC085481 TaxID=3365727 RepID=UPI0037D52BB1
MNAVVPELPYVPDFRPTHVVPRDGLPAWEAPDPGLPTEPLDAFLPVQLVERVGDWGQILCSNGWTAWVDARLLVAVPTDPPAAGAPLTRTADPRPLIARVEDALGRYRRAAEELAGDRVDGETFRRRTHGLRVGMVVDGESLWLFDAEHERWVYCDGTGLSTYATSSAPSVTGVGSSGVSAAVADAGPSHEPTQVVAELPQLPQVLPEGPDAPVAPDAPVPDAPDTPVPDATEAPGAPGADGPGEG